jgi:hypothetical protein
MKLLVIALMLASFSLGLLSGSTFTKVLAACGDTQNSRGPDTFTFNCRNLTLTKTSYWTVYWLDGYSRPVDVTEAGEAITCGSGIDCYPRFDTPYFTESGVLLTGINPPTAVNWPPLIVVPLPQASMITIGKGTPAKLLAAARRRGGTGVARRARTPMAACAAPTGDATVSPQHPLTPRPPSPPPTRRRHSGRAATVSSRSFLDSPV